jgi:hypothetical protein
MANPLSVANLRQAFAARLLKKPDAQTIPSWWDTLLTDARDDAYNVVLERLQVRGYTIAQIDAWPRCEYFVRRIALCQLYNEGLGLHAFDDKITAKAYCDAEKQLDSVMVTTAAGPLAVPNAAGICSSGSLDYPDQLFVPPTSLDTTPTKWGVSEIT